MSQAHPLHSSFVGLVHGLASVPSGACSAVMVGGQAMPGAFFSFGGAGRFARVAAFLAHVRRSWPECWLAVSVMVAPGVILVGVAVSQVVLAAWPGWSSWSAGSFGFVRFARGGGQPRPGRFAC